MADLLECLLQLKALKETPARLARTLETADAARWADRPAEGVWAPVEIVAHLADTELFYGVRVRMILTNDHPRLERFDQAALAVRSRYRSWSPRLACERFGVRRAETLELLESCSGEELNRVGVHAVRGEITLADLVAIMLAHDTDHLAQVRARLGLLGDPTKQRARP